jgi:hypothetical protein
LITYLDMIDYLPVLDMIDSLINDSCRLN